MMLQANVEAVLMVGDIGTTAAPSLMVFVLSGFIRCLLPASNAQLFCRVLSLGEFVAILNVPSIAFCI